MKMKAFLITLSALALLSCNKGREIKAEFGEEVSAEAVDEVFMKATKDIDPMKSKVGQSSSRIVNLRVENSERFIPVFWDRTTLLGKVDTSETFAMHLKVEEKDLTTDPPEERVFEDDLVFKKSSAAMKANQDLLDVQIVDLRNLVVKQVKSFASDKPTATKYYNLKNHEGPVAVPDAVKQKANCLGLADCKMHVYHLEYDEVNWFKDGSLKRIRWTYEISPDAPYLGAMTTVCAAQEVPYEDTKVYVRNCRYVVDFQFEP